ncbi:MAG: hypothetical protein NVSMB18_14900 [Acetobacteraceae bacterium]
MIARAAGALETRTVEIAGVRDPQLGAQLAIGDAYGYFRDEGLDINLHWNQSAADTLTTMASGVPVGVGGIFSQVVFAGQKLPIKTITALADISETQGFVISPGIKLNSPKDLEGKKLAFTQGNSQVLLLAKLAKDFGFDTANVTLVNMQPSEGVVAAAKGDVQGLLGWQPNLYRLEKLGGTMYANGTTLYVTGKEQKLGYDDWLQYNHSVLLASQDWIDHKPNTLQALLRALKKATDLLASDRPKALAAMKDKLKIDADALEVMATANKYKLGIDDRLAKSLAFQADWAMQIKRVTVPITPADAFAPGILAAVDPSLVSLKV